MCRAFFGGGGERTIKCPLQNQFWRPLKVGFVWSVSVSSKEHDRAWTKRGGGKRIISGGVPKPFLGMGLYGMFSSPLSSPPLAFLWLSKPNMTGRTVQWKWSPPAPASLKALQFPPLLNRVQNKGTQGAQARYSAELPPFISIVLCPGRPVILDMEISWRGHPCRALRWQKKKNIFWCKFWAVKNF